MKRLFPLFLLMLLLSGCGSKEPDPPEVPDEPPAEESTLSEETVQERYEQAVQTYNWFDLGSMPTTGEPIVREDNSYRQVDYPGITTYAELEAHVRSLFAPSVADALLSESVNYTDIDGRLCCAEGARGSNIDLWGTSQDIRKADDTHWTVTVRFWTDLADGTNLLGSTGVQPAESFTFGYSEETLNFEMTDEGMRFTNFCSSDALDMEADTVCTFSLADVPDQEAMSDWQLLCWMMHTSESGLTYAADELLDRFSDRPEEVLYQMGVLYGSPFTVSPDYLRVDQILQSPTAAVSQRSPEEQAAFRDLLEQCQPESEAAQSVLDILRTAAAPAD